MYSCRRQLASTKTSTLLPRQHKDGLELLERLVEQFEKQYDVNQGLLDFLATNRISRMDEVLQERELNEEERRAVEDAGVVWDTPSEDDDFVRWDKDRWMRELDQIMPCRRQDDDY